MKTEVTKSVYRGCFPVLQSGFGVHTGFKENEVGNFGLGKWSTLTRKLQSQRFNLGSTNIRS